MTEAENTVFISYRRTNIPWALAVYQNLTRHGYDVFMDYNSLDSGDFEQVILNNVLSRAHFVVILTPSALERCNEPGDWLRREIETALDNKRNIIPLMFEGFNYDSPAIAQHLTGKLELLRHYQSQRVPADFFEEAMTRVRERYLNKPLDAVLHPRNLAAAQAAIRAKSNVEAEPAVDEDALNAQEWFEKGYQATDAAEKVRCYSEAIRLDPTYAMAYNNRAFARKAQGDFSGAIADSDEAIRLQPDLVLGYLNRGSAKAEAGDLDGAIADYDEAIRQKRDYAHAYVGRGRAKKEQGKLDAAIADYDRALRIQPDYVAGYFSRAVARKAKGDIAGAINDYSKAIEQKPDHAAAYNNRGELYYSQGKVIDAMRDFAAANEFRPGWDFALGGLAVTHHSLGRAETAADYWRQLTKLDSRYANADWTADTLNWPDEMREEARKVAAKA